MSNDLIANLKADYPVWEVKNKLPVSKEILLADGESLIVPGKGVAKIAASNINNFPDFKTFEFVTPDLKTLASYGVIERKEAPVVEAPVAPAPAQTASAPATTTTSSNTSSAPSKSSSATDNKSTQTAAKE